LLWGFWLLPHYLPKPTLGAEPHLDCILFSERSSNGRTMPVFRNVLPLPFARENCHPNCHPIIRNWVAIPGTGSDDLTDLCNQFNPDGMLESPPSITRRSPAFG